MASVTVLCSNRPPANRAGHGSRAASHDKAQHEIGRVIPGLSSGTEAAILAAIDPTVTAVTRAHFDDSDYMLFAGHDPEAQALGVVHVGGPELTVVVIDPARPVGSIRVQTGGGGNLLFIDNRDWQGTLNANIRILGSETALLFNDVGPGGFVTLNEVFLRSSGQFVFWGRGATAVGCCLEVEGNGQGVVIGDDALISNGVWVRNYDMHALTDLRTGKRIGRPPLTTVLERHVWLGQDALLLGCERIGAGSVIGARSLVKGRVPAMVVAAGTPARVVREQASWGRDTYAMTQAERLALGLSALPQG